MVYRQYCAKEVSDGRRRRAKSLPGQAGEQGIEDRNEDESVWLTQRLMVELFAVEIRTISEHLGNIFQARERWNPQ